jgi:glycosyltransferase involved in cell wall biosynthesis
MLPYGIQRLRGYGIEPIVRDKPRGARRILNKAGYQVDLLHWGTAFDPRPRETADVSLAWDERTGIPIALTTRRRSPLISGCIWAADLARLPAWHLAGYRRMDAIWIKSTAMLRPLELLGLPPKALRYIPMGISADFYRPEPMPEVPHRVFCVGHDRHRDYDTLLRAVATVRRAPDMADMQLELVTPDPVEVPAELGRRVPHVPASQLRELYSSAPVVAVALSPNLHVSGVTATLESMACGRALVVTGNPGMEEYVDHGRTGLLVPPGDSDAMAAAITELLRDPDRRREMGEAGRRWVLERFTTSRMAESVAELIREIVG